MNVKQQREQLAAPAVLTALLNEFSTVTDYRTLRDSLPRRLAHLLNCRCIVLYLRVAETLQLVSGSFDDKPGWSADLLAVAHVNPISIHSDLPEARAWRERSLVSKPATRPVLLAVPLIYRQRAIGVLVALRAIVNEPLPLSNYWHDDEMQLLEAVTGVVALLLENTRLLEHDRERIHELSLLNSISSQLNCSVREMDRLRGIVIQRTKEIAAVDVCELLEPDSALEAIPWITPLLRDLLFQHVRDQHMLTPLIIERATDGKSSQFSEYFEQLPTNISTFVAFPLAGGHTIGKPGGTRMRSNHRGNQEQDCKVFGIIVGAYYHVQKLRQVELTLLQVLSSQASIVLENMHLLAEVVEARNEARRLLRQVVDDQRLKELILESIPTGLITTDQQGHIHTFNRAAESILGYHPYEVLGQSLHKFLDLRATFPLAPAIASTAASTHAVDQAEMPSIYIGDAQRGTVMTVDRCGDHEVVLDVDLQPLCNELGTRIGLLVTFTDMTSLHHLEEEKRRLDRLASLGEMAANVAHEVRNPLASIKTSIQMLRDDLLQFDHAALQELAEESQSTWIQTSISVMLKEVERLDCIVRDLLLFARPRQLRRSRCNVVELSEHVLTLIQGQCTEANVAVHRVYAELPAYWVDMDQLEQIQLNLYMNALQAMPEGGILTVAYRNLSLEHSKYAEQENAIRPPDTASWTSCEPGRESSAQQWLEMVVSDTGIGIEPDQLEKIFQPFYTTRAHGIGLGLAITRRLIEDHAGYIRVESQFGYGTTIIVRLPAITDAIMERKSAWEDKS